MATHLLIPSHDFHDATGSQPEKLKLHNIHRGAGRDLP